MTCRGDRKIHILSVLGTQSQYLVFGREHSSLIPYLLSLIPHPSSLISLVPGLSILPNLSVFASGKSVPRPFRLDPPGRKHYRPALLVSTLVSRSAAARQGVPEA